MSKQKQKEYAQTSQVKPLLQVWWGDHSSFVKVPSSGALRWKDGKYWIFGDLVPPTDFPFCIELKNHEAFDMDEIFRKKLIHCKITWYWYFQVIKDSIRASTELGQTIYPMMIFKTLRNTNRLIIQSNLFWKLPADIMTSFTYMDVRIPDAQAFVIVDLIPFLEKVPRPVFEKWILGRDVQSSPASIAS